MRRTDATLLLTLVALWLAGCASESERYAFSDWATLAREVHPGATGSSSAQVLPEPAADAGLADLLAYAALRNPGLEAAFNRWKAALERVPQARSLSDPRFTYRYFIEEVETRVGPQRQSFELAQTFPWFGKLELRGDAALEAAQAARQRYEAEKLSVFYRVKQAYWEYAYWSRAVAITRQNRDLLSHLEQVALARYRVAAGGHPDVIRAQVELGKMEDRLRSLEDLAGPLAARLNAALGRAAEAKLPQPQAAPDEPPAADDAQVLAWLEESNPELEALSHEIAAQERQVELARKDRLPDVTLGVQYVDTESALMPGTRDSGKDPVIAMVSVNLPIWFERLDAAEREAQARVWAAVGNREERRNRLATDVKMTLYELRDAARKINLYRDTLLPKAEQSFKVTESAFQAGKAGFLDVLESQRVLLDFQLSLERALASRAQRQAELEMLIGRPLPPSPVTGQPEKATSGAVAPPAED